MQRDKLGNIHITALNSIGQRRYLNDLSATIGGFSEQRKIAGQKLSEATTWFQTPKFTSIHMPLICSTRIAACYMLPISNESMRGVFYSLHSCRIVLLECKKTIFYVWNVSMRHKLISHSQLAIKHQSGRNTTEYSESAHNNTFASSVIDKLYNRFENRFHSITNKNKTVK